MPNYQIIKDESALKAFIEWLPELTEQETFYCCLFARSKYTKDENGVNLIPHLKTDKSQLKRFVSTKDRLYRKIKELEIEEGCYYQKELKIPQESLALYMTVNPRSLWKATFNSVVKLVNCIRDQNTLVNPHAEVMSEIQRTKSRGIYVTFDMDFKGLPGREEEYRELLARKTVNAVGNKEAVTIIETRGGYHILINANKVAPDKVKSFFLEITSWKHIDQGIDKQGNPVENMIPIVGCTQGGFIPHFINV